MPGHGAFKFASNSADLRHIAEFKEKTARRGAIVYAPGDRVRWIQKPKVEPARGNVTAVSPSGASVRVRFDERQREFEGVEVWLDKQAIEPEE